MNRYRVSAVAFLLCVCLCGASQAQSPWESGSFKGYDQSAPDAAAPTAPATDSQTGALGLQGFTMSPSASGTATTPAAPQPQVSAARPVATTPASSSAPSNVSAALAAQIKNVQGMVADTSFVTSTQQKLAGLVQASQLAQKNGSTPDMQKFAGQMASIYSNLLDELNALAKKAKIQPMVSLPPENMDKLRAASGAAFDTQYMKTQKREFSILIKVFQREAQEGQNADIKAFAASHLDMLTQQDDMIKKSLSPATTNAAAKSAPSR